MSNSATDTTFKLLLACESCKRQFEATDLAPGSRFHCSCGEMIKVPEVRVHDAAVVRCSSCSAPRKAGTLSCEHCGADYTLHERDLHTICPKCMTRVSDKAKYCHHCATPIVPQGQAGKPTEFRCPSCGIRNKLNTRTLGEPPVALLECPRCAGLWLGGDAFQVITDRARQDTLPEEAFIDRPVERAEPTPSGHSGSAYRRCPLCRKYMNRRNFGKRSGVIIDSCKDHGLWFDAQELGAILRWIKKGGEVCSNQRDQVEQRHRSRQTRIKHEVLERAGTYGPNRRSPWQDEGSRGGILGDFLGALFDI